MVCCWAATSFIHMQMFDAIHVSHSMRNTGWRSGAQVCGGDSTGAADGSGAGGTASVIVARFY